jgi:hypothetical protein
MFVVSIMFSFIILNMIRIVLVWDGLGLVIDCQNVRYFSAGVLTGV